MILHQFFHLQSPHVSQKDLKKKKYSQKRFNFFTLILLHLQQPTVAPLPEKGSCIRIFTALSAHVQPNILSADCATEL